MSTRKTTHQAFRSFLCSILAVISASSSLFAQTPHWEVLKAPPQAVRYDDIFFITPRLGWTVHPYNVPYGSVKTFEQGQIWKTTDGGANWTLQLDSSRLYLRSVLFVDSLHGWVGSLGYFLDSSFDAQYHYDDSTLMLETTDGGNTWHAPSGVIIGKRPSGLCGMQAVNHDVVYMVGRYSGPTYLLKTTNSGKTWTSIDMNGHAGMLVDCHFWNADTGIVIGGTSPYDSLSKAVILATSDGGAHWDSVYTGKYDYEWCWKVSFPTPEIGYVSVETSAREGYLLKTTDKGLTWNEVPVTNSKDLQGVGFINDSVGWTGGWQNDGYATTDGGKTWRSNAVGRNVNRFRFFGDSLGYCSGRSIYKLSFASNSIPPSDGEDTPQREVGNYPNPFKDQTSICFAITKSSHVRISIFDITGKWIATVLDEHKEIGDYVVPIGLWLQNRSKFPPGMYYYEISNDTWKCDRKMVRIW